MRTLRTGIVLLAVASLQVAPLAWAAPRPGMVSSTTALAQPSNGGIVVAWGDNEYGQTAVPAGLRGVTAVAAAYAYSLALKNDGTVVAWGCQGEDHGQCAVPTGLSGVTAISAGRAHSLALRNDGTVVAWGCQDWDHGQCAVPPWVNWGKATAIAAGSYHNLALLSDGTIMAWGYNEHGQTEVPPALGGVTAIAAGFAQSLALKNDGTVVAWGCRNYDYGQCNVPVGLSGVKAIAAAGDYQSLALRNDGTVVAWGCQGLDDGQCTVPPGLSDVIAISAGEYYSLALKSDGTVVVWGCKYGAPWGECSIPAGLRGVTAIAAGSYHILALAPEEADLQVAKTASPDPIFVGQALRYTLMVTNTGYLTATDVILTDTLPAGVMFSAASDDCTETSGLVTCDLDSLPHAASASLTLVVTPTTAGRLTNTVSATTAITEAYTANNTASATTTVRPVADVRVSMRDSADPVWLKAPLTYTVNVTNDGPSPATGVTLTDILPISVAVVSAAVTQGSCSGTTAVICHLGTITNGAGVTLILVVTPSATGMLINTVSVAGNETDLDLPDNMGSEPTAVVYHQRFLPLVSRGN
jgi:uncharacterized repeat protein (TIGR01451 family)